jgi:hypothetical protein
LQPDSIEPADPDPGEPKLSPKKGRKRMLEELERSLLGFKKTYMAVFDQQNYSNVNFLNFIIKNLGLDPDWIQIPQQAGSVSGSRFS